MDTPFPSRYSLPLNPTISQLKEALQWLWGMHTIHVPVSRADGKKGAPLKADYWKAILPFIQTGYIIHPNISVSSHLMGCAPPTIQFNPVGRTAHLTEQLFAIHGGEATIVIYGPPVPQLPEEILLDILCLDPNPYRFIALSRKLFHIICSEEFCRKLCFSRGYTTLLKPPPGEKATYTSFFLAFLDVSRVVFPVLDFEKTLKEGCLVSDGGKYYISKDVKYIRIGQLEYISKLFGLKTMTAPRDDPRKLVKFWEALEPLVWKCETTGDTVPPLMCQ